MVPLFLVFSIYFCFSDLISALPQKFWLDLLPNCYSHHIQNLGKVSILVLMGKIGDLKWVIRVGCDTLADTILLVNFNVGMMPNHTTGIL